MNHPPHQIVFFGEIQHPIREMKRKKYIYRERDTHTHKHMYIFVCIYVIDRDIVSTDLRSYRRQLTWSTRGTRKGCSSWKGVNCWVISSLLLSDGFLYIELCGYEFSIFCFVIGTKFVVRMGTIAARAKTAFRRMKMMMWLTIH